MKRTKKEVRERMERLSEERLNLRRAHDAYVKDLELENKLLRERFETVLRIGIDLALEKVKEGEE